MESNQSHSGSGDNIIINALGGGDAVGGDKVSGNKTVIHNQYQPEVKKEPVGKEYRLYRAGGHFDGYRGRL